MVEQKANLQQQEAGLKRAEKTRMAAPKCASKKMFRHLCRTYSIDEKKFKKQQTVQQQAVQITTFRPQASSGKTNERQYEKARDFMKKKDESEV